MIYVHIGLQSKGGVGKTYSASALAQYFQHKGADLTCIDADSSTPTLSSFKSLKAVQIAITEGSRINIRGFDAMIEKICSLPDGSTVVVDTGSSTFLPLAQYFSEAPVLELLKDQGCEVVIHSVVKGGQEVLETINSLASIIEGFPDLPVVVWKNEFTNPVAYDGKAFEASPFYQKYKDRFRAVITLPEWQKDTYGEDLKAVLEKRLTFAQALADPAMNLLARMRVKAIWNDLINSLEQAKL
ncbi:hypothetical protein [Pseudovibrio sp. Tun.PSC04-5.I4]|uniref:nucleotide-binding protein n=1 Tax=Pseudovibrio sp. Tun.PSC04-5.I4 TaxID=1798213 RepID=UPI0008869851|nr:hypothetical protein [Pseudovibrio sp. Tun.PSC04-5.I4]SDR49079.1 CobQ/CobB/MinD/ParA nucleotide binding domain-containing protein [Pseudovibrio sp. Tun.PSC04-5.I4]